jgi:hypothetical protein
MSLTLRKSKGEKLSIDELDGNFEYLESISGGTSSIENITYLELYNLTINNELTPLQWYRLTDYKSVNFINGYQCALNNANLDGSAASNLNFVPRAIYTGDTEVLLLKAISSGEISTIGYSETYYGDIVEYTPLTNKIGVLFNITNGGTLPNGNPISGFDLQWDAVNNQAYFNMPTGYPVLYGQVLSIYAYFDDGMGNKYEQNGYFFTTQNVTLPELNFTSDNPILQYPISTSPILIKNNGTRVVLTSLTQNDVNVYQSGTLNVNATEGLGDAYGWITKRVDTLRNVTTPFDFRGRKYRRFEVDLSLINGSVGTSYNGIGDNFGGFGTTGDFGDFKCFENATNLNWAGLGFGFDSIGENDNNVIFGYISDTTIKNGFANNTFGCNFGNISDPSIENCFIDNYFRLNVVGFNFKNNTISSTFQQNIIGNDFQVNIIPRNFLGNYGILNGFQRNTFNVDTQYTDYSNANHVYGSYTCTIDRTPNGTRSLTYVDDRLTLQVVSATD